MRCAKGITLAVGHAVGFHTWDESDPANPVRQDAQGVVTELSGEVARNQTLGEVTLKTSAGSLTLPAAAVSVIEAAPSAPAAPRTPAKRKTATRK